LGGEVFKVKVSRGGNKAKPTITGGGISCFRNRNERGGNRIWHGAKKRSNAHSKEKVTNPQTIFRGRKGVTKVKNRLLDPFQRG